jgi:hypothetical protein
MNHEDRGCVSDVRAVPRTVYATSITVDQSLASGSSLVIRPEASSGANNVAGTTVGTYPGRVVYQVHVQASATHAALIKVFMGGGTSEGRTVQTTTPIAIVLTEPQYLDPFVLEMRNTSALASNCSLSVDIVSGD